MMVPLNSIFEIEYGNQLDLVKLDVCEDNSPLCVNLVSRSASKLGIAAKVERIHGLEPYEPGLITVALGGSVLSSFVQLESFYTAQNIKVLAPKRALSYGEKLYYCLCIKANAFRYSTHGREANQTLNTLLVPAEADIPNWAKSLHTIPELETATSSLKMDIDVAKWSYFKYSDLFKIERGKGARKSDISDEGKTPFISSIDSFNGLTGYVDAPPAHCGNVITVNRNGSIAEAFYQPIPFCSTEDVHVFIPNFQLTPEIALFLISLIRLEKPRYSYGRKWSITRMKNTRILLPTEERGEPDWGFMTSYIQQFQYSEYIT